VVAGLVGILRDVHLAEEAGGDDDRRKGTGK